MMASTSSTCPNVTASSVHKARGIEPREQKRPVGLRAADRSQTSYLGEHQQTAGAHQHHRRNHTGEAVHHGVSPPDLPRPARDQTGPTDKARCGPLAGRAAALPVADSIAESAERCAAQTATVVSSGRIAIVGELAFPVAADHPAAGCAC